MHQDKSGAPQLSVPGDMTPKVAAVAAVNATRVPDQHGDDQSRIKCITSRKATRGRRLRLPRQIKDSLVADSKGDGGVAACLQEIDLVGGEDRERRAEGDGCRLGEGDEVEGVGAAGDTNVTNLGHEGVRLGGVDCTAVNREPDANLLENVSDGVGDGAIGARANVQEEIAALGDNINQRVDEIPRGAVLFRLLL